MSGRPADSAAESSGSLVPSEAVERRILAIRSCRVLIDADLAELYGVPTKRLNQQVNRNRDRFPEDFLFQLTQEEKEQVVANCDHLRNLKFSPTLPWAFTEHGAIMAANMLKSPRAVLVSIQVVRAFVRLREMLISHRDLARKLEELEAKYDAQFGTVFDAIRALMAPPSTAASRRRIGFRRSSDD